MVYYIQFVILTGKYHRKVSYLALSSEKGLKIHIVRAHSSKRQWIGSTADKETRTNIVHDILRHTTSNLKWKWGMKKSIMSEYGSRFQADGSHLTDIKDRISAARLLQTRYTTYGFQNRHLHDSNSGYTRLMSDQNSRMTVRCGQRWQNKL